MNKNDECDIVKDLASLHIDNILSKKSKEFVDNHLNECENCKKYYEDMSDDIFYEENKEKCNDQTEVDHLRRVNKKMTILKWILTAIIIAILIGMLAIFLKISYIDRINDLNISKMLYMQKNSDNYKLVQKTIQINKKTNETNVNEVVHYYKDGKHKEVFSYLKDGKMIEETIRFIDDYGYDRINVFHSLKQIDWQKQDFIEEKRGDTLNIIISRVMLSDAGIHNLGLTTRTEMFENKECYVVSSAYNGTFRDNYIDKETGNLVRVLSGSENFYNEEIFTLEEGVVTDNDVDRAILESEQFKDYKIINIDYKIDENFREFYENYL